jgi:arginyl-tRNA synthetase
MLYLTLEKQLHAAVRTVLPEAALDTLQVRPCADPKFGDYQCNLMGLAKQFQRPPRPLAEQVKAQLAVGEWCEAVELAGAGFLNFRLRPEAMARELEQAAQTGALFFTPAEHPRTVVVDFSSPNVAKPMHVGHIRSTILGDSLARILRLLGHRVITDNHLGDWGTQFGKLLLGWKQRLTPDARARATIDDLERLYKEVNAACEADPAQLEAAKQELVKLQQGDPENLTIWQKMIELSRAEFDAIYQRLGVRFDYTLGESYYNPFLKQVVQDLLQRGIARESDGAVCVFSDGQCPPKEDPFLIQRDGQWVPNPCLILKSDGAANYATTDLATLDYRWRTWRPDEIIYVTDGRQQLHFRQVFAVFARWQPEAAAHLRLAHVWFGSILGDDGKPFKTRSGETIRLSELLDEAEERTLAVVNQKNPELPEEERRRIARVVGIGAVKYADLLPNRQSDYVFSWEKMLSLQGNSAVYLLYAYARIRSIFRKGMEQGVSLQTEAPVQVTTAEERALGRHLLNFGLVLRIAAEEYRPNYLCNYLYELAGLFARFFEQCPVLKSEPAVRASRLKLCDLTARVLKQGLEVLGIETLEQI